MSFAGQATPPRGRGPAKGKVSFDTLVGPAFTLASFFFLVRPLCAGSDVDLIERGEERREMALALAWDLALVFTFAAKGNSDDDKE